ncbi:transglycosylase domain-containing protein [Streptomyces albipurpureus]|uniref:Penicillin-binding protein n=1 Tax=Streptomyces albipurpureus TaxID=2897419 RepID=A0ABT0UU21_9ACTN|nr:transglycosylase domain-containing protein [Streptomyces sp. CWNU-1]MCM2391479.1 penicillin-binding protein [Streptomyces sp. CWNU-1]
MSEHRRKSPQPQSGGRAAARRAAQQPSGRRAAPPHRTSAGSASTPYGDESPSASYGDSTSQGEGRSYGGRAESRRAAQGGGGRRRMDSGAGAGGRGGGRRGGGGGGRGPDGPRYGGDPGKRRLIDYPRRDKDGWGRWVPSWKLATGICLGFIGTLMAAATVAYAMVGVPDPDKAATAQNNVYLWDDGTQMAATGGEINRQNVDFEQIPLHMQNAVISAENKTFWSDEGIDPMGISRALVNMAKGGQTQGGSTITQQYVKNNRLRDQSQTLSRKFKELFISMKIDNQVKKSDIMAGYLNTSYYGRGAYGIQAAARTYYETDANKLTASQSAVLAALLKGPTYFDPAGAIDIDPAATQAKNYKRAAERWSWILDQMVKDGHLDSAERDQHIQAGYPMPKPIKKGAKLGGQVGYLVDLAKANFLSKNDRGITAKDLAQGGYEIHTTFNKSKVKKLEKTIADVYKKNIDPKKRPKYDTFVQFGGASVEPSTGKIVAIYGGEDATRHFINNANETGAQVGSTFKPFVLAAAMTDGVRDPKLGENQSLEERTLVDPDKAIYNGKNKLKIKRYDGSVWRNEEGKEWLQVNDNDQSYKNINLRDAMIVSANSPFVQLGMDIGIPQVREAASNAGLLESSLDKSNVPSFSIGISSPSAIRMAGAYGTFAANGQQRDPYSVQEVKKGALTVYKHKDEPSGAFPPVIANTVTDILRDVVDKDEGTGKNARIPGRPVAGKTGTTDGNKSAWFVGYTPQLSTAIDMFRLDSNEKNKNRAFQEMFGTGGKAKIHGSSFPSEIWQRYMSDVHKGQPVKQFPKPGPFGEAVWGGGASSPPPSPLPSPSKEPSEKPSKSSSPSASKEPSPSPSTSPSKSCDPWGLDCGELGGTEGGDPGGNGNGSGNGSASGSGNGSGDSDGGVDPSPSPSPSPGVNSGKGGGWLGGPDG